MTRTRSWTDEDLTKAVDDSRSLRETLLALNLAVCGGGYVNIRKHIARLNLNTDHWSGQAGKGRYGSNKKLTLDEILVENSTTSSAHLRKILIREGLKRNVCEECDLDEWLGTSLTCELHHRNEIRTDNRLENLQILCPNCHSQK